MAANTGRTHSKYIKFYLDNSSGTLTDLSNYVDSVGSVGLNYDKEDVTAFGNSVKNVVIGQPDASLSISGPFDTVVHAHMIAINGLMTPLTLDIRIGIRQAWEAGEPQFGITSSATSGYVVNNYMVDPGAGTWSAQLDVFGGTAPAWGTAAET